MCTYNIETWARVETPSLFIPVMTGIVGQVTVLAVRNGLTLHPGAMCSVPSST